MGETTAEEYDDNNDGRATLPVNARPSVVALLPPESATSAIASDTVGRTMIRPTFPPKLYYVWPSGDSDTTINQKSNAMAVGGHTQQSI